MTASPFMVVDFPCKKSLQLTNRTLTQAGLRVLQTFDLKVARHSVKDCACPNHGTSACDCQMVILLVYGNEVAPVTLILDGNHSHTRFSVSETPNRALNERILNIVRDILNKKTPAPSIKHG